MEIKSEEKYMITLIREEISALDKFIGNTSSDFRKSNCSLTQGEDGIVEDIYDMINNALEGE